MAAHCWGRRRAAQRVRLLMRRSAQASDAQVVGQRIPYALRWPDDHKAPW